MFRNLKITSSKFLCSICFSLCFFTFMLIEAFINERSVIFFGCNVVNIVYTLGLVFTGLGFLSFSFLCKICKSEKLKKIIMFINCTLCLLVNIILALSNQPIVFLISSMLALLLTGNISSYIYYKMAINFKDSKYTGRVIGIGMGIAIILQYIVQNLMPQTIIFIISILLNIIFVIYYMFRKSKDINSNNVIANFYSIENNNKMIKALIIAVILMSLVAGMIDSVLTSFNATKEYDIYNGVRLFYALGLVLAGFIADTKSRIYLPLATLCAILLSSICIFFLSEEISYFAGTALMYLYSGFYVIFFTIMFLDFAPNSKCPELWASMGRIIRSFTVAATIIPAINIYNAVGNIALATISCLLSITIMLVLLPFISKTVNYSKQSNNQFNKLEMIPQERLKLYAEHCLLTPRETEVLEKLLTTDDDLQGIADSLYISRRMVQRYVTSIYEKTDTKTRHGLFQSYINFTIN